MFTALFHIPLLEAIEKCFTVSTEQTGLKGWEMCHQVILNIRPLHCSRFYKDVMHVVFLLAPLKASRLRSPSAAH